MGDVLNTKQIMINPIVLQQTSSSFSVQFVPIALICPASYQNQLDNVNAHMVNQMRYPVVVILHSCLTINSIVLNNITANHRSLEISFLSQWLKDGAGINIQQDLFIDDSTAVSSIRVKRCM